MSDLTVGEWQTRLEQTFLRPPNELGTVRLEEATVAEELHSKLRGHSALLDSFHEFFLRTLRLALTPSDDGAVAREEWWMMLLEFLTAFRTWRAAELIFRNGYPLAGYVLLRDLKDRAIVLGAVGHRITTLRRALGYDALRAPSADIAREMKKLRKKEEWRIRELMLGATSGLSSGTVAELGEWEDMFHAEVHGARLSQTEFLPWIKGEQPLTFGPRLRESGGSAYTNRAAEVGWMWTSLLPLLQTGPGFGAQWGSEWQVLEDSFRYMVVTLKELEKPGLNALVDAVCELVADKFAFDAGTRFPDS